MNLNQMKVSTRLAWGFGAVLALLLLILTVGLVRMKGIADAMEHTVENQLPKLEIVQDILARASDNARLARDMILYTDEKDELAAKAAYDKNRAANSENYDKLEKTITQPTGVELFKDMVEKRKAYLKYTQGIIELGMANKNEEAIKLLHGPESKTQEVFFASLKKLAEYQKSQVHEDADLAKASYEGARTLMISVGVLALVVGVALALVITRGISRQLGGEPGDAADLARAVAQGDLTRHISVRHGDSTSLMAQLKTMSDSLTQVVARVRSGSEGVSTASAEIAQGNHDLSSRTESQASALEETAASMEELSSTVKQNADNARQANQLAVQASSVAVKGGEVVGQVVHTMKGISEASNKIADIISVIDGIAFQTNILALNAAVEAARAGEQGRGFAVVASEVRSLAGRSAEAAKEIKTLITASVERVEQGSAQVDQAGATMTEVVASIQRVADIMGEISAATSEQAQGVAQVGEAVQQMDQVTQQNAALVEEMAAAASSLKGQAADLVQAVSVFQLEPGQGVAHGSPVASAPVAAAPKPKVSFTPVRPVAVRSAPRAAPAAKVVPLKAQPALATAGASAGGGDDWASF